MKIVKIGSPSPKNSFSVELKFTGKKEVPALPPTVVKEG
jgi:hypothetical protein